MPSKILIGADHRGFDLKEYLKERMKEEGIPFVDFGTDSRDSVDYPDIALKVAERVSEGGFGVLICKTGIGMCITANKVRGVRAARVLSKKDAILARRHNDANLLCLPGEGLSKERAWLILKTFLNEGFEGGRHRRRVKKIEDYERRNTG